MRPRGGHDGGGGSHWHCGDFHRRSCRLLGTLRSDRSYLRRYSDRLLTVVARTFAAPGQPYHCQANRNNKEDASLHDVMVTREAPIPQTKFTAEVQVASLRARRSKWHAGLLRFVVQGRSWVHSQAGLRNPVVTRWGNCFWLLSLAKAFCDTANFFNQFKKRQRAACPIHRRSRSIPIGIVKRILLAMA